MQATVLLPDLQIQSHEVPTVFGTFGFCKKF